MLDFGIVFEVNWEIKTEPIQSLFVRPLQEYLSSFTIDYGEDIKLIIYNVICTDDSLFSDLHKLRKPHYRNKTLSIDIKLEFEYFKTLDTILQLNHLSDKIEESYLLLGPYKKKDFDFEQFKKNLSEGMRVIIEEAKFGEWKKL